MIIFIGKLLSFPAKYKKITALCVPACRICIHLVTQSAIFYISRSDGECFPIEYYLCALVLRKASGQRKSCGGEDGHNTEADRDVIFSL